MINNQFFERLKRVVLRLYSLHRNIEGISYFGEVYFHQDHLHLNAGFNRKIFWKLALSSIAEEEWLALKDTTLDLQLLEGSRNTSKNDTSLIDWVNGSNATGAKNVPDLVNIVKIITLIKV